MSRILAYTSPAHGHLFPLVPILLELRRRGHRVALRTLASEVGMLRSIGIDARPIAAEIEAARHDDWKASTPTGAAGNALDVFCDRAEHDARDLQRAVEAERPEALLVDIMAWGALGAAEAWGGPWGSFCPLPLPFPSSDAPPFGPGLRPARGPLGLARDRLLRDLSRRSLDRRVRSRLNEVRGRLGLPPLAGFDEVFLGPPLLLYMTSDAFDYPRSDWPGNVVMVGPCAWDPPAGLPAELKGVEAPLVLVTTSSEFQNDGALARTALQALAGEPCHVVASLPAARIEGLQLPPNASALPWVPHGPVLARSICAITHGGMGVTQKALARGVPVCVVPFGRDQREVARRVEVAGVGARLSARRLRPDRLRAKVREAIERRADARRVARAFAATGGARAAANAVEDRLLRAAPGGY